MVYVSGGKNRSWIRRKLKLGGILISIATIGMGTTSCVVNCHAAQDDDLVLLAALQLLQDQIIIIDGSEETESGYEITISLSDSLSIQGRIENRTSDEFSYILLDGDGNVVQSSDLFPVDGTYDSSTEEFRITLDPSITVSDYTLKIYSLSPGQVDVNTTTEKLSITVHVVL